MLYPGDGHGVARNRSSTLDELCGKSKRLMRGEGEV
jgi:hypothetical protein